MTVKFSQRMMVPSNLTRISNGKALIQKDQYTGRALKDNATDYPVFTIQILPGKQSNMSLLGLDWTLKNFTETYMLIELDFYSPLYVSLHSKSLDRILIVINDPTFFISQNG